MLTIELALADDDAAYLDVLARFLVSDQTHTFLVHAFNQIEPLLAFLKTHPECMYLLNSRMYEAIQRHVIENDLHICLLIDDMIDCHHESFPTILKYQKGGEIARQVAKVFAKETDKTLPVRAAHSCSIMSVLQVQSNVPSIALTLARALANDQRKVLYLPFDPYVILPEDLLVDTEETVSDLFYYAKKNLHQVGAILKAIKVIDPLGQLHYIPACGLASHYDEMHSMQIEALFQYLKTHLDYDLIVVEVEASIKGHSRKIMDLSHYNLRILTNDPLSSQRAESLLKQPEMSGVANLFQILLNHESFPTILNPTIQLKIPYNNLLPTCDSKIWIEQLSRQIGLG